MKEAEWEEAACKLLELARQASFAIGDEYIGTQHLLLAAVALTPVEQHGFSRLNQDDVLATIIECLGVRKPHEVLLSPSGQTPRAKLVITHAWERAKRESRQVSCRDIWAGLLADQESEAQKVIHHLGLTSEAVLHKLV
jgi:ATP-dependent Clp protease ATP-binding subunit ClpA